MTSNILEVFEMGGKFVADKVTKSEGDRVKEIFVWPAAAYFEPSPKNYTPEYKAGKTEPYKTFKKRVHETYNEFNELAKEFNSCIEDKKWPETKKCMKLFTYCFGKQQTPCDTWSEENRGKRCRDLRLDKCLEQVKEQFNVLKNCFDPNSTIGFSFIAYDYRGLWEEAVGIRTAGGEGRESVTCDFTYSNNRIHLIQIMSSTPYFDNVGVPLPEDYNWKYKK
jgi:hypothetical protein